MAAATFALVFHSHGVSAFDFASADKFGAVGQWRIHHESGRVSVCEPGKLELKTWQWKTAPKCTPWSKSLGTGKFRLVKIYDDNSGIMVIDTKTGRVAFCDLGFAPGGPICSPLSND